MLPAELRDMIYERIFDEPIVVDLHATGCPCAAGKDPHHDGSVKGGKSVEHFASMPDYLCNPEYVGRAVKKELAVIWYSHGRFVFLSSHATGRFLQEDHWGPGLEPRHLVNNISILIRPRDLRPVQHSDDPGDCGTRIMARLRSLRDRGSLKTNAYITFTIDATQVDYLLLLLETADRNDLHETLRAIVKTLHNDQAVQKGTVKFIIQGWRGAEYTEEFLL